MIQRLAFSTLACAALLATLPAHAITDGELDGNRHPNVGLMVALDATGAPMWRCSGTLVSPRHYLTAGHCTYGASRVTIWFDADVDAGRPGNGYPTAGQVFGTPYAHPDYPTASFVVNDVGVVVLDQDAGAPPYATLPHVGDLDALAKRRGKQDVTFTAVGYGLQKSFPDAACACWPRPSCCRSTCPGSPATSPSCCPTMPTPAAPASATRAGRTSSAIPA
jgi:hypothetical protein